MPSAQLLTKQVIGDDLNAVGRTFAVRFNLQRGKIARIWGFSFNLSAIPEQNREFSVFVRKTSNAARIQTPVDLLWTQIVARNIGTSGGFWYHTRDIMFPKPHRTSGITVQMHANSDSVARGVLIIYYDIDDVEKGELVQKWEKNISKGRTSRTIAP